MRVACSPGDASTGRLTSRSGLASSLGYARPLKAHPTWSCGVSLSLSLDPEVIDAEARIAFGRNCRSLHIAARTDHEATRRTYGTLHDGGLWQLPVMHWRAQGTRGRRRHPFAALVVHGTRGLQWPPWLQCHVGIAYRGRPRRQPVARHD